MIKTIIFDFDMTLYRGDVWRGWDEYCIEGLRGFFPSLNKEQWSTFFNKYFLNNNFSGQLIAHVLNTEKGSAQEWIEYQTKKVYLIDFDKAIPIDKNILKKLSENHSLYIVSNSPKKYIDIYSEKLNIDVKLFKSVFQNQFLFGDDSKAPLYKHIVDLEKITPSELLVIGDSFSSDIKPALKIGAKGLCFSDSIFTYEDIIDSKEYRGN